MPYAPEPRLLPADEALDPRVGVVVPVHRQPQFVANAIRSALENEAPFAVGVVVVNDGCPFASTERNALRMRDAAGGRVAYLAQANAGLSAARNAGIRHALEAWPAVEALLLLDADNELGPATVATMAERLEADPGASWTYAYREMFGAEGGGWEVPGPFNRYRQLFENQCDAASLIRRSVFEAGLYFDESMRSGYEDWEFFIRAMEAGLRGVPAGRCGFRYRRRWHSMVERSMGRHERLLDEIHRRHPDAYTPRALTRLEHDELPRFALLAVDQGTVALGTCVDRPPRVIPVAELDLAQADGAAGSPPAPPVTVVGTGPVFEWLRDQRLLAGVLLAAQQRLAAEECVAITLRAGELDVPELELVADAPAGGDLVAFRSSPLLARLRAGTGAPPPQSVLELRTARSRTPPPAPEPPDATRLIRVEMPADARHREPLATAPAHAAFAERLHLDRLETTFPWVGDPSAGRRAVFVLTSEAGPRPELVAWLAALRRAEPGIELHLVLAGAAESGPSGSGDGAYETVTPVACEDEEGAAALLEIVLRSADVVMNSDCRLASRALPTLAPGTLVVDASTPIDLDRSGLQAGGQIDAALKLEALVDLFLVEHGGSTRLVNLDVIKEKIVELPVAGNGLGPEEDAGVTIVEALAAVAPRPGAPT